MAFPDTAAAMLWQCDARRAVSECLVLSSQWSELRQTPSEALRRAGVNTSPRCQILRLSSLFLCVPGQSRSGARGPVGPRGLWARGPVGPRGPGARGPMGAWACGRVGPWGLWARGTVGRHVPRHAHTFHANA